MPQIGHCSDVNCNERSVPLYECHCCNRFVCFKHLLQHVERAQHYQEKLQALRDDLWSTSLTLKTIVERKEKEIEHDKYLVTKANQLIDSNSNCLDDLQSVFDELNQTIKQNCQNETLIRVEPILSIINDSESIANSHQERGNLLASARSPILIDQTSCISDSMDSIESSSTVRIGAKNEEDVNQNEDLQRGQLCTKSTLASRIRPTQQLECIKRSIFLNPNDKSNRVDSLDTLNRSELESAITKTPKDFSSDYQSPKVAKMTDENAFSLTPRRRVPCPLSEQMINLFGCPPKSSKRIPCQSKLSSGPILVAHLSRIHNIRPRIARPMIKTYELNLNKMISDKKISLDS